MEELPTIRAECGERPGVAAFEKDDHAVIRQFLSGHFQPALARRAYFWFIFWAFPRLLVPVPSHFESSLIEDHSCQQTYEITRREEDD